MAVAVYLRVSTEEQRERQSIATQREFGERYCQLHNLAVYRVYADDGVSGTVPLEQRPDGEPDSRGMRDSASSISFWSTGWTDSDAIPGSS